jgi:hypothetical protein
VAARAYFCTPDLAYDWPLSEKVFVVGAGVK